jgi:hypothetical protein
MILNGETTMLDLEIVDRHGRRRRARPGEIPGDGERVVFSPMFMDDAAYGFFPTFSDGSPDSTSPHRPGFRFLDAGDPSGLAAEQAYEERRMRLAEAWRKDRQDSVHDLASRQLTLDELRAKAEQAREDRDARMRDAWRRR